MSRSKLQKFLEVIKDYDEYEYLLSVIMCNAIPTIKNEKTASLITFSNDSNRRLKDIWGKYKGRIKEKLSVNFFELKHYENSIVVLFYNEDMIKKSIKNKKNMKFLKRFGYSEDMNIIECLKFLSERFEKLCPHEIGIFLGYPIEDVITFVDCPNTQCKLIGYWKVYHDVEKAKDIFKKYDFLRHNIVETILKGCNLRELELEGIINC